MILCDQISRFFLFEWEIKKKEYSTIIIIFLKMLDLFVLVDNHPVTWFWSRDQGLDINRVMVWLVSSVHSSRSTSNNKNTFQYFFNKNYFYTSFTKCLSVQKMICDANWLPIDYEESAMIWTKRSWLVASPADSHPTKNFHQEAVDMENP